MKFILKQIIVLAMLVTSKQVSAQNLLDLSQWVIGTGSTGIFNQNGTTDENTREWGMGDGAAGR